MNFKQYLIVTSISVCLTITILINHSGILLSDTQKQARLKDQQYSLIKTKKFMALPHTTLDGLEQKIKDNKPLIVYFGWFENCGDSRLFELNSFDTYLKTPIIKDHMVIVNLDKEAAEALLNKDLRAPIARRFQIDQWMKDPSQKPMHLQAPQIAYYKDGHLVNLLSWTPLNADYKYGINPNLSNKFFHEIEQDLLKISK